MCRQRLTWRRRASAAAGTPPRPSTHQWWHQSRPAPAPAAVVSSDERREDERGRNDRHLDRTNNLRVARATGRGHTTNSTELAVQSSLQPANTAPGNAAGSTWCPKASLWGAEPRGIERPAYHPTPDAAMAYLNLPAGSWGFVAGSCSTRGEKGFVLASTSWLRRMWGRGHAGTRWGQQVGSVSMCMCMCMCMWHNAPGHGAGSVFIDALEAGETVRVCFDFVQGKGILGVTDTRVGRPGRSPCAGYLEVCFRFALVWKFALVGVACVSTDC